MMADRFAGWNEITGATTTAAAWIGDWDRTFRLSPRPITPNRHIGQLGWLKLTVPCWHPRPSARRWRGVNPVVIDASAGAELAADTLRGRALRALLPADAVPWVPELFFAECGSVLRRWDSGAG